MKRERCPRCTAWINIDDDVVECLSCDSVVRVLSWEPITFEMSGETPIEAGQVTYDIECLKVDFEDSIAGNAELREIDLTKPARALRFLRHSDYVLVLGGGSLLLQVFALPITNQEFRQGRNLIGILVIGAVLAFCAYTGYRHVGVIDDGVWRSHMVALPMLLVLCALIAGATLLNLIATEGEPRREVFSSLVCCMFFGWIALVALVSVFLLRRMRIGSLGVSLVELLSNLRGQRGMRAINSAKIKRVGETRGVLVGFVGGAILVANLFFTPPKDSAFAEEYYRSSGYISLLGYFLLVRARRYFQVSADSLLAADQRDPILFLRAFDDDEKQRFRTSGKAILDFSLETRLSNHFAFWCVYSDWLANRDGTGTWGGARHPVESRVAAKGDQLDIRS